MNQQLTLQTYQADKTYAAAVTKSFAGWGLSESWSGIFGGQGAGSGGEGCSLRFPAGALTTGSPFTFRSKAKIALDGKNFFCGYIAEDHRTKTGSANESTLQLRGPWWFLENLVYQFAQQYPVSFDAQNNPTFATAFYTHFTLNLLPVMQFTTGQPFPSFIITPQLFKSRAMISKILDFAKSQGAWLDYNPADIMDVAVHPRDVINIHCADAILAQVENYDAVIWFDHSVDPPMFHCQRRKDLPAMARSMILPGKTFDQGANIEGFKLRRRYDLACPYVQIAYEQPVSIDGVNSINQAWDIYPPPAGWAPGQLPPAPTDSFKALITTVPVRALTGNTHQKFIQTLQINLTDIGFWQAIKPIINPAINPNATIEYDSLVLSNGRRSSNLVNMVFKGGYADWMGGTAVHDELFVQASYHRKQSAKLSGTKIPQHTWAKRAVVTNLNFPGGLYYQYTTYSSDGDVIDNFMGMAQDVYNDLNPASGLWEGAVPLLEDTYSGQIVLGKTLNLNNTLPEHATMAALIQTIEYEVRSCAIYYSLQVGPNKTISAQQIADRLRAAKYRYITVFNFAGSTNSTAVLLTKY